MPLYTEPVAPLGPVYQTPAPRGAGAGAAGASFDVWKAGLAGPVGALGTRRGELGQADANLVSLSSGMAQAARYWETSPIFGLLVDDTHELNQPNPIGTTIPLSLTVPNVGTATAPNATLGAWTDRTVSAYLNQLLSYLLYIGLEAGPVFVPPAG